MVEAGVKLTDPNIVLADRPPAEGWRYPMHARISGDLPELER